MVSVEGAVAEEDMVALDRWIVARAKALQKIYRSVTIRLAGSVTETRAVSIELGSFYLDVIKDRQYTASRWAGPSFMPNGHVSYH